MHLEILFIKVQDDIMRIYFMSKNCQLNRTFSHKNAIIAEKQNLDQTNTLLQIFLLKTVTLYNEQNKREIQRLQQEPMQPEKETQSMNQPTIIM